MKPVRAVKEWLAVLFLLAILSASAKPIAAYTSDVPCTNGTAAGYACQNIDLIAHLPLEDIGGDPTNGVLASDIWGWTSPTTNKEYVLIGLRDGTSFVDISDASNPIYLGKLPSHQAGLSDYRDIKVYKNHAYIVGDQPYTNHGMQIFDLTQLETVANPPLTFSETAHYNGIKYAHNLWINEATGFAYLLRTDTCNGSTHIVNINNPTSPTAASTTGCNEVNGADSDTECIIYNGPDSDYAGQEICFTGSDDTATISDVTNKSNPITIADFAYPNIRRAHQGALTSDGNFWLISDTMDEAMLGFNTRTIVIDVTDLDNPQYVGYRDHGTTARDHNIYVNNNLAYMTNWRAGFRVADMTNFNNWQEIAYFDTYPANNNVNVKSGAWSHYDWFDSKTIAVSDVEGGLFLLRISFPPTAVSLADFSGVLARPTAPLWLAFAGLSIALLALLARRRVVRS